MKQYNWATQDGKSFKPTYSVIEELSSGSYKIEYDDMSSCISFTQMNEKTDELLSLPNSIAMEIVGEINHFWKKKNAFKKYNYIWKRGILMYGPPGSGKSSTISLIKNEFIRMGGIVMYPHRDMEYNIRAMVDFRLREPDRPILLVMEDIETILNDYYSGAKLLAFLDGEFQTTNIVVLATTNKIADIPETVKFRPGRFDIVKFVGLPSDEARRAYLLNKVPAIVKTPEKLDKLLADTDGFYYSHLKELIIALYCLEADYDDTITRLRSLVIHDDKTYMSGNETNNKEVCDATTDNRPVKEPDVAGKY